MKKTVGFIGTGNMGGALAKAAAKSVAGEKLFLADKDGAKAARLAKELGCAAVSADEAAQCDFVFLGIKPQFMAQVLGDLAPVFSARTDRFVLVTMAAGLKIADIQSMAGGNYPTIRIMPNIPASVGQGVILYDASADVTEEEVADFCTVLSAAGLLDRLPEALIDAGSAVSGCGPAFAALFAEALADGGVANGLPRDKAVKYAAQMLLGSAALLLETGMHPGQLKDAVCSPGGSTIAGVRALEQGSFRAAVMDAVDAAVKRTKELGK